MKRYKLKLRHILTATVAVLEFMSVATRLTAQPKRSSIIQLQPEKLSWEWVAEPWTGSDRPYTKIRQEVEEALSQKRLTIALLRKIQLQAQQNPHDAQAQFRWGYTLYKAPYAGIDLGPSRWNAYTPIVQAFSQAPSPRSYNYARLRFLLMSLRYQHSQLKGLGLRLLRREPQDYDVKFNVVQYLSNSSLSEERQKALQMAQEMVRNNPKRASAHSTLASVYQHRLFMYGDQAAAEKAVVSYRKYLELAPLNKPQDRALAQRLIQNIQREKIRQQQNGFKPPLVAHD